uniref:Reverse transcriptase domain-containing protein n=1 Tax=Haemonchus contortus TaxID=6289 RepID=A0A7I4Y3U9_HAECO
MEKIIYDFCSDLFDSYVCLPTYHLRHDGHVVPSVLLSEIRHAISSLRNDEIVFITSNIDQAEQMLDESGNACGKIGLRLNLTKAMFTRNGLVPDAPSRLNGTNLSDALADMCI